VTLSAKRQAIAILTDQPHQLSIQRACRTVRLSRAAYYRPPRDRLSRDQSVIDALQALVAKNTRWGFWKCHDRFQIERRGWNHKRVHRVYCALGLNLPRRTRRRLPKRIQHPLEAPPVLNRTWAIDYMCDTLYDGRRYRILNVIDEGNREALAIDIGVSLPSVRLVQLLDQLIAVHGVPKTLRADNGPELTSTALNDWCEAHHVALRFIQPGKPQQNAFIERFNRTYRDEVLNAYMFTHLEDVRTISADFLTTYNSERPHDSLGRVPPLTFLPRPNVTPKSSFDLSP
jgi:putative transposase